MCIPVTRSARCLYCLRQPCSETCGSVEKMQRSGMGCIRWAKRYGVCFACEAVWRRANSLMHQRCIRFTTRGRQYTEGFVASMHKKRCKTPGLPRTFHLHCLTKGGADYPPHRLTHLWWANRCGPSTPWALHLQLCNVWLALSVWGASWKEPSPLGPLSIYTDRYVFLWKPPHVSLRCTWLTPGSRREPGVKVWKSVGGTKSQMEIPLWCLPIRSPVPYVE